MDSLLRRLVKSALRRGMAGEHWAWFVLGIVALVLRRARTTKDESVSLRVKEGERYLISVRSRDAVATPLPAE